MTAQETLLGGQVNTLRNEQAVRTSVSSGLAAESPFSLVRLAAEALLTPDLLQSFLGKTHQTSFLQLRHPPEQEAARLIFTPMSSLLLLTPTHKHHCKTPWTPAFVRQARCWEVPCSGDKVLMMGHSEKCFTQRNSILPLYSTA